MFFVCICIRSRFIVISYYYCHFDNEQFQRHPSFSITTDQIYQIWIQGINKITNNLYLTSMFFMVKCIFICSSEILFSDDHCNHIILIFHFCDRWDIIVIHLLSVIKILLSWTWRFITLMKNYYPKIFPFIIIEN